MAVQIKIEPACLELSDAAAYVGLGSSTWQELVRRSLAPPPRELSAKRVGWLRKELDQWLDSRPKSTQLPPPNTGAKKPKKQQQSLPIAEQSA